MSLWILIPLSFVHITVGGAIGFGLVFAACAERGVTRVLPRFHGHI